MSVTELALAALPITQSESSPAQSDAFMEQAARTIAELGYDRTTVLESAEARASGRPSYGYFEDFHFRQMPDGDAAEQACVDKLRLSSLYVGASAIGAKGLADQTLEQLTHRYDDPDLLEMAYSGIGRAKAVERRAQQIHKATIELTLLHRGSAHEAAKVATRESRGRFDNLRRGFVALEAFQRQQHPDPAQPKVHWRPLGIRLPRDHIVETQEKIAA